MEHFISLSLSLSLLSERYTADAENKNTQADEQTN